MFVLKHESLESYRTYIHAIVGFFIVEDHVLNTGNGLITRAFLDEMWTMALSKIVTTLQTHSVFFLNLTINEIHNPLKKNNMMIL